MALHAPIEAARVGAEKDGFAVVADGGKTLAEQSHQQATEIETADEKIETPATSSTDTVDDRELIELEANHWFQKDRTVAFTEHLSELLL